MEIIDSFDELVRKLSNNLWTQSFRSASDLFYFVHVFLQVHVEEFEYEVEFGFAVDNIEQTYDVFIFHLFEQRDFTNGGRRYAFIFLLESDLL